MRRERDFKENVANFQPALCQRLELRAYLQASSGGHLLPYGQGAPGAVNTVGSQTRSSTHTLQ